MSDGKRYIIKQSEWGGNLYYMFDTVERVQIGQIATSPEDFEAFVDIANALQAALNAASTREAALVRYISDLEHIVLDTTGYSELSSGIRHVPHERAEAIYRDINARYTDTGELKAAALKHAGAEGGA